MPVTAGTRLGPYEITTPLGAGGMGEVYRARDTRLGRDVAIKVLPQHLSSAPEVRARFEREARTVSSLNHPHICTLFDVGRESDTDYLVMELVEGETLAQRLARGPLATGEVLRLGAQIADALDRAHRAGVVHRDLKPGNVMLTKSGAKLMDFGLARATGMAGPASGSGVTVAALTQSPTVAAPLTAEGTIIGTFQYMAPEQLEGKEADARSDLWALGCVLYEMATGRRAFEGKSQASLIGSIMNNTPPPISAVSSLAPPALERLVRNCLEKDPEERVQTAHDVRLQLQGLVDAGSQAGAPAPNAVAPRGRERLAWAAALLAAVVAAALGIPRLGPGPKPPQVVRFLVSGPAGVTVGTDPAGIKISPDGRTLVFLGTDSSGTPALWARPLASLVAQRIGGTDNAAFPFWSPDSRMLGFFADSKLKKVPIEGGSPEALCDAPDGRGGSWSKGGVIVFAPMASGPIARVSEDGGEIETILSPDSSRRETGLRWPEFLPDGKHFLFAGLPSNQGNFDIYVGTLGSKERRKLLSSGAAPVYTPPGYLLFVRNGRMMAQRFDVAAMALKSKPEPLGEAPLLSITAGAPATSVSANGILAHPAVGLPDTKLVWLDRAGHELGVLAVPAGRWEGMDLSRDGKWLVAQRRSGSNHSDLWMIDVARSLATRFTFGSTSETYAPVWAPDGKWVAYDSDRQGPADIFRKPVGGSGDEEPVLESATLFKNLSQWTPDGSSLIYYQPDPETGWDIWRIPLDGERKPVPVIRTRFNEYSGQVSPDRHWIAYYSDESGRPEVYVRSYPEPGQKYQVSTAGGIQGVWSRDGRELLFGSLDGGVMVATVKTTPTFTVDRPRLLFKPRQDVVFYTFASDFSRFIASVPVREATAAAITVELDWIAGLKR